MARDYRIEIVKGDKIIPVDETGTGREGEHPNIIIREKHGQERALTNLLANPTASLKGKDK